MLKYFLDKIDLENAGLDKINSIIKVRLPWDLKNCPLSMLTAPCSMFTNKPNLHFHNHRLDTCGK